MIGRKADRVTYGTLDSQFVEVWDAPGAPDCTVVLLHGGFWRAEYDLGLMDGLAADTARRGWKAVNVEYRRGKGWPAMADDVRAAWSLAVEVAGGGPLVVVGHSAGGHLGVWLTATSYPRPLLAISLAGVVDLRMAQGLDLGRGAVDELFGGDELAAADPAQLVPTGVPVLLVAPVDDVNVPRGVSASYADKARAAGDDVAFIEPPGDHMAVIDPSSQAWAETCAHMSELVAGARRK